MKISRGILIFVLLISIVGCKSQLKKERNNNQFKFLVLSDIAVVNYNVDEYYSVNHEKGINYNDQNIRVSWMLDSQDFIISNKDKSFPIKRNVYMPGCGAMVGAIAKASNKDPDFVVGKPNTYILSKIEEAYEVKHHEIVVIGDSYESDIMMAMNNNSKAILVNSKNNITNGNVLVMDNPNKILRYFKEYI